MKKLKRFEKLSDFSENYQVEVNFNKNKEEKCRKLPLDRFPNATIWGLKSDSFNRGECFRDCGDGDIFCCEKEKELTTITIKEFEEMLKEEGITEELREEINGLYFVNSEWSEEEYLEVRKWLIDNGFRACCGDHEDHTDSYKYFSFFYHGMEWCGTGTRNITNETKTTYKEFKEKYMDEKEKFTHVLKSDTNYARVGYVHKTIRVTSQSNEYRAIVLFSDGDLTLIKREGMGIPYLVKTSDLVKIDTQSEKKQALIDKAAELKNQMVKTNEQWEELNKQIKEF